MLNNVMTLAEAAELWQLKQKSLMRRVIRNKDNLQGINLSANVWLITWDCMISLYGELNKKEND